MIDVLRDGYGVTATNLLLRIAQQVDLTVTRFLDTGQRGGFDPVTRRPSVSRLEYHHGARSAQELQSSQNMVPEKEGNHAQQRGRGSPLPWVRS